MAKNNNKKTERIATVMTNKIQRAAFKSVVENADELFDGERDELAIAAGIVANSLKELLSDAVTSVAHTSLEVGCEADSHTEFAEKLTDKLKDDGRMDELIDAMAFTHRFLKKQADEACERKGKGVSVRNGNVEANFGRN